MGDIFEIIQYNLFLSLKIFSFLLDVPSHNLLYHKLYPSTQSSNLHLSGAMPPLPKCRIYCLHFKQLIVFILILKWISKKIFLIFLKQLTFYDLPSFTGTFALLGTKEDSSPINECSFACGRLWTSNDRMLWMSTILPFSFSYFTILISYSFSFKYISSLVSNSSNLSLKGFVIPSLFNKS